ncbi:Zn-dependent hydrolase [Paenibacillus sp. HB172176]|uniref:Zn-dependent hydrolase n=1 Tax=Paenibacillus sp. HB172176 TaxID=2493690 RepID=UPI00143BF693|nr:Zn-dependent hydrolase [Paenibacillus sp. HB172176]
MEQDIRFADLSKEELLTAWEVEVAELLDELAVFTKEEETAGVTRLLYTKEWLAAQQALRLRMENAGLVAVFDEAGNLFGKIQGINESEPSILTGSHIDTVVQGGKYDGAYGIAAGLAALSFLYRIFGKPKRSLELVSLSEEEGSRFPMAYWGSGSIVGQRRLEEAAELRDVDDMRFDDAMKTCGFGFGDYSPARRDNIAVFLELHIEQGGVLEKDGLSVGIVEAIAGQRRFSIQLEGAANHAGTTPMGMRRDALEGAAAMIYLLHAEALKRGDPLVATAGRLLAQPNVPNVVAGKVEFTVDVRHGDEAALDAFCKWMAAAFEEAAEQRGLAIQQYEWFREKPARMDAGLRRQMAEICEAWGISHRRMISGAGHDAQMLQRLCKTALLFVPSRHGISHSPEEFTSSRELAVGVLVLAQLLYRLGYQEEAI